MTAGSKGLFGYVGTTMDGTISLVKDRSQMIQIITKANKKYLFSCQNREELVTAIHSRIISTKNPD